MCMGFAAGSDIMMSKGGKEGLDVAEEVGGTAGSTLKQYLIRGICQRVSPFVQHVTIWKAESRQS